MNKVYILLGGNLGDKHSNLQTALKHIEKLVGKLITKSSIYETEPWGFEHEQAFLNQVILIETKKNPADLLVSILNIETLMGRKRVSDQWNARTIDIDILFFNDEVIDEPNLKIPHPRLHQRKFTLVPLNEIAENFIHPVLKKRITDLLVECEDGLLVKRC